MLHSKNSENIYGYTGKKLNFMIPSLQTSSSSNKNALASSSAFKVKSSTTKETTMPDNTSSSSLSENVIKTISFSTDIEGLELDGISWNEPFSASEYAHQRFTVVSSVSKENETMDLSSGKHTIAVMEMVLVPHEKGYSVRSNGFDYQIELQIDGEKETIHLTKKVEATVCTTKMMFQNHQFPFYYRYEDNPLCDAIFNDYIKTQLMEIKPPNIYMLPVKITNQLIMFRQYIGYMKTKSFLSFKIGESGWYVDHFSDESGTDLVNGVNVKYQNYWYYHPRGSRIEHHFIFL